MHNLKLSTYDDNWIKDEGEDGLLKGSHCVAIDVEMNLVYIINGLNQVLRFNEQDKKISICGQLSDSSLPIGSEYLIEDHLLCVATIDGYIYAFNTIDDTLRQVGRVDNGLQAMCFSHDQELVVFLSQSNSLILMTKTFEVVVEKELDSNEAEAKKAVTVGWGSEETQFHGSEGKDAWKTKKETIETGTLMTDDRKARISWRGDGQYFVTSFLDNQTGRKLKIWNRDGELQSISESVNGLEHLVSWKPSGNLIASSQQLANKHQIVFFEKNGLRHGEFSLPFVPNSFIIEMIAWSIDSQLLLISGLEIASNHQLMMLWECDNYEWCEKQRLSFRDSKILNLMWHPVDKYRVCLVLSNHQVVQYNWKWQVDKCEHIVANVNGKSINLSDFERAIIPPPMCYKSFQFEQNITSVCFSNHFKVALILNQDFVLYSNENVSQLMKNNLKFSSKKCDQLTTGTNHILSDSLILYFVSSTNGLCSLDLNQESCSLIKLIDLNLNVLAMCCDKDMIAIVMSDGKLIKYECSTKTTSSWTDIHGKSICFQQPILQLEMCFMRNELCVIAYSNRGTLYLNNDIIADNNCTSFNVFNKRFLLHTTDDNILHCWEVCAHESLKQNTYERSVERGSKIITTSKSEAKVILKLPRGNLETIYPRPLVLAEAFDCLDNHQFLQAFTLFRKHRINLNLMSDHNQDVFLENIDLFVSQLSDKSRIDWICLYLAELEPQDIAAKTYSFAYVNRKELTSERDCDDKIDLICDALRNSMISFDTIKFLHPILLTFIKKTTPEFSKALELIKSMSETKTRDNAIKFLSYFIDINKLFDEALGTYDFDIVLMVADKSQKDPKEYLMLIEDLKKIDEKEYRFYKIDLHLKRFQLALAHISKCCLTNEESFDEAVELIKQRSLYKDAIIMFESHPQHMIYAIWKLYGEYLLTKRYYQEAAIAFKRCKDYSNALKACQLSGDWNSAIAVASKCASQVKLNDVYENLAYHLETIGKFSEAAYLHEKYLKDKKRALMSLINGHVWDMAVCLLGELELENEDMTLYFNNALKTHHEMSIDTIRKHSCKISVHRRRLKIVREMKNCQKAQSKFESMYDDFSETSSMKTGSLADSSSDSDSNASLATRKSSKSLRKQEKKKYILKEGSRDEDLQLIFEIKEIITSVDSIQEEISVLIRTLFDMNCIRESSLLQTEFAKFLELIKETIREVWPEEDSLNVPNLISDMKLQLPPILREINWKLALI